MYVEMSVSSGYLLIRVPVVDIERVHGLHNGHDGLQGVAVDDGNELQAFFKRVTIFVDNSGENKCSIKKMQLIVNSKRRSAMLRCKVSLLHLFDNSAFA